MDSPVFGRVWGSDDHRRVEEPRIPDSHAGFDAVAFRFNGGSNHTPVGAVVGRDNDRFSAKEGISLLLTCANAELRSICIIVGAL